MSVEIIPIDLKEADERGALHYFKTDRTGEFLLVYRKAGTISGQHFHLGLFNGKNPEDLVLVQGSAKLHWKDLKTNKEDIIDLVAPIRVLVQTNIWHELTAITDIIFIELNSLKEGSEDTHRL